MTSSALVSTKSTKALSLAAGKRAQTLLASIATNKAEITRAFFDIGLALRELLKKKLYASLGCTSFKEMLTKHRVMSSSQAFKLVSIVEHYSRKEALTLGLEKAHTLVQLAAATAADDTAQGLAHAGVVVNGKRKAVAGLSVGAIQNKVKRTRQARTNAHRDPARHAAEQLARSAEKSLHARGMKLAVVEAWKGTGGWMARVECRMGDLEKLLGG